MRFIHTADWHLGRLTHGIHLTRDQEAILEELRIVMKDFRPDALLICGDIYDRAVPPPDAVRLLDDFLSYSALDLKVPVLIISGNHDSSHRLEFASRVLAKRNLHLFGSLSSSFEPVTLFDAFGPVHFFSIPYSEPSEIKTHLDSADIEDSDSAYEALLQRLQPVCDKDERRVLLAHAFVGNGTTTESERPLLVGGIDKIAPDRFSAFHYVALGHLHRPQQISDPRIRYAGSIMKYSFSEADHVKGVNLVEMDSAGNCIVKFAELRPKRDMRIIEGNLKDILSNPDTTGNRDDYLMVRLSDKGAILDVMGKLREVYPNVLHVERAYIEQTGSRERDRIDHRKIGEIELFRSFFSQVTDTDLTIEESQVFAEIVEELRRTEREAPTA